MPSKVKIKVTEFMCLGINIFWAFLRAHFNPRLATRAKMSLSQAQNTFMPANINSIVLLELQPEFHFYLSLALRYLLDRSQEASAIPSCRHGNELSQYSVRRKKKQITSKQKLENEIKKKTIFFVNSIVCLLTL